MKRFKVGIIGLGLIGKKRALNLGPKADLIAYCDLKKKNLHTNKKIRFYKNWKDLIQLKELDIIIISTIHVFLAPILLEACKYKKNIFIEKPASIDLGLLKKIISLSKLYKNKIRVGYNHRFYPSILKSRKIIDKGLIGKLMFIKSSYGHGGRPGYEKEWRLNSKLSGGGELIDQGSHLIDLSIFFLGKVKKIKSKINNYFWKTNVDDNAFVILEFVKKYISFFHVSCTEWKNNFTFEIYGTKGKLKIEGKGGSYGREKLTLYEMKKNVMLPFITTWKFQRNDTSWQTELNEFYDDINFGREPNPNLNQAYEVLKIVKSIYRSNKYDHCS
jgi:predicted dehydrogenase